MPGSRQHDRALCCAKHAALRSLMSSSNVAAAARSMIKPGSRRVAPRLPCVLRGLAEGLCRGCSLAGAMMGAELARLGRMSAALLSFLRCSSSARSLTVCSAAWLIHHKQPAAVLCCLNS